MASYMLQYLAEIFNIPNCYIGGGGVFSLSSDKQTNKRGQRTYMKLLLTRRAILIAVAALALTAGLAFAADKKCGFCNGTGNSKSVCSTCKGTGLTKDEKKACNTCDGRRFRECGPCDGTGVKK